MANVLPLEKQLMVLRMLCEGNSLRAVTRVTGVHRTTVMNLMVSFGEKCQRFMDRELRDIETTHVEIDEQWTWVAKKQGHLSEMEKENPTIGDQYLFLGLEQDSRLIISHLIGKRTEETTRDFMHDLARRIILPSSPNVPLAAKPQLSTDGFNAYPNAIFDEFGGLANHGVIIKNYSNPDVGRYAPPDLSGTDRRCIQGITDLMSICTSHIERFNCTTRHFVKRFCRLTLAFSKKLENLKAAVSLYVAYYNWVWRLRENGTSGRLRPTPAMMAGIIGTLWKFEDLYDAVQG